MRSKESTSECIIQAENNLRLTCAHAPKLFSALGPQLKISILIITISKVKQYFNEFVMTISESYDLTIRIQKRNIKAWYLPRDVSTAVS